MNGMISDGSSPPPRVGITKRPLSEIRACLKIYWPRRWNMMRAWRRKRWAKMRLMRRTRSTTLLRHRREGGLPIARGAIRTMAAALHSARSTSSSTRRRRARSRPSPPRRARTQQWAPRAQWKLEWQPRILSQMKIETPVPFPVLHRRIELLSPNRQPPKQSLPHPFHPSYENKYEPMSPRFLPGIIMWDFTHLSTQVTSC
mmetsp:Transcript_914/g.1899  ORF Transcript_914/g.1899 Transcript_914/m.1899 type:complete len:201 (+) Transcript_914:156-758(+)